MKKLVVIFTLLLTLTLIGVSEVDASSNELSNRVEAIVKIGEILGLDGTQRETKFKDVPKSHYASGYIASAVDKGIVSGYADGTFKPYNELTRAHLALFIDRALGKYFTNNSTIEFKDVPKTHNAYNSIKKLAAVGITTGYKDATFKPNGTLTKAHLAIFMDRTIKYVEDKGFEFEETPKKIEEKIVPNTTPEQGSRTIIPNLPDPYEDYEGYLKALGIDMTEPKSIYFIEGVNAERGQTLFKD